MKTFISNLKRAIQNRESVTIGGGQFSPDELRAVLSALENSDEKEKAQAIEKQFANVNKNQSELLARAYGIAESHFFSDDECQIPWEPLEHLDDDELSALVNDLAELIYQSLLWAQGKDNEN